MRNLILILALCVAPLRGQEITETLAAPPGIVPTAAPLLPLETRLTPATYLSAGAAQIFPKEDGSVVIFAEELKPGVQYGMVLTVENQSVDYIEIHPKANPFPAIPKTAFRPRAFLIEGKLGDEFWVSIRARDSLPTWVTVKIITDSVPVPPDPPAPPTDGKLEKLSRARADALNDPTTRSKLKQAIMAVIGAAEAKCAAGDCPGLSEASGAVVNAVEAVLAARTGQSEYVEWKGGWRDHVNAYLKTQAITTTAAYLVLMTEAASGL